MPVTAFLGFTQSQPAEICEKRTETVIFDNTRFYCFLIYKMLLAIVKLYFI